MTTTKVPGRRHDVFAYGDRLRAERRRWLDPQFVENTEPEEMPLTAITA